MEQAQGFWACSGLLVLGKVLAFTSGQHLVAHVMGAMASAATARFCPGNAEGILVECSHPELLHPLDTEAEAFTDLWQLCSHSTVNTSPE